MSKMGTAFHVALLATAALVGTLPAQSASAADSVTLITDFGYNGRHSYFFVAQDKGFYKEAGIDVKFVGGKGSVDTIKQVAAGNANFGFADAGSLVLSRANDNIPVKMVAVVYARPPQAIFCAADAGLKTPKDLEGKSIANPAGGSIPDMFPAFAKAASIDASKVNWVVGGANKNRTCDLILIRDRNSPGQSLGAIYQAVCVSRCKLQGAPVAHLNCSPGVVFAAAEVNDNERRTVARRRA